MGFNDLFGGKVIITKQQEVMSMLMMSQVDCFRSSVFLCFLFQDDTNFSWANAGATVFGSAVTTAPKNNTEEDGSDEEEAPNNVDIHFEPIVSLPEVSLNLSPWK